MLIYTPKITNRLKYIFEVIFTQLLGVKNLIYTTSKQEYEAYNEAKICYAPQPLKSGLYIQCSDLLFEKNIKDYHFSKVEKNGIIGFFKTKEGSWPFDPFSASFYLLSRYEEYLPHKKDNHKRFLATESIAYKFDFLSKPIVNIYALELKKQLEKLYRNLKFKTTNYKFVSTIDVDNAYAYLEKGFVRTVGAYFRDLFQGKFSTIKNRTYTILGKRHDDFDTFGFQLDLNKTYNFNSIYFFLLGDYDVNDKNVSHTSRKFQQLIKHIADYQEVALHPSYASIFDIDKLKIEQKRLENIVHKNITQTRQHFLVLNIPSSYRVLLECGFQEDYTMGYATHFGFRAGICTPFNFFDLEKDIETSLVVHPFCTMEATLKYYQNIDVQNAFFEFKKIIDEVKAVNGTYMSIWHNDSLSDTNDWKGWKDIYTKMVKYAVE